MNDAGLGSWIEKQYRIASSAEGEQIPLGEEGREFMHFFSTDDLDIGYTSAIYMLST